MDAPQLRLMRTHRVSVRFVRREQERNGGEAVTPQESEVQGLFALEQLSAHELSLVRLQRAESMSLGPAAGMHKKRYFRSV